MYPDDCKYWKDWIGSDFPAVTKPIYLFIFCLGRIKERKSRFNYIMAELIGDVRELLQNILSDPFLFEHFVPKRAGGKRTGRVYL